MIKPGDAIERALKPIVNGTRLDGCEKCKKRKEAINNSFTSAVNWVIGLFKRKYE
jgi:hypothetical protein